MAACFLGSLGGDFTCTVGRDPATGSPYICERFSGAFDMLYGGIKGSIYVLPGDKFREGETQWDEEVISSNLIVPLREIIINNVKQFLLDLSKQGKLIIRFYPDKIANIPEDDEDLVYRAIIWARKFGDSVIAELANYHPHLVERVNAGLKERRYLDPASDG